MVALPSIRWHFKSSHLSRPRLFFSLPWSGTAIGGRELVTSQGVTMGLFLDIDPSQPGRSISLPRMACWMHLKNASDLQSNTCFVFLPNSRWDLNLPVTARFSKCLSLNQNQNRLEIVLESLSCENASCYKKLVCIRLLLYFWDLPFPL